MGKGGGWGIAGFQAFTPFSDKDLFVLLFKRYACQVISL